jgi:dTDP-4-dehydrorhamnose 3,5-epimerase
MRLTAVPIPGAYVIELEPIVDERGFFARTWCKQEFRQFGLNANIAQCSISFNTRRGTLRGMHYQDKPHAETKLVRCSAGGIYDVIVDLRLQSPSYCRWFAVELTAANQKMLYVPESVAHGFQTLADHTEVVYQISDTYQSECARGVRWDDPLFGIEWPIEEIVISQRDRAFPDFVP